MASFAVDSSREDTPLVTTPTMRTTAMPPLEADDSDLCVVDDDAGVHGDLDLDVADDLGDGDLDFCDGLPMHLDGVDDHSDLGLDDAGNLGDFGLDVTGILGDCDLDLDG